MPKTTNDIVISNVFYVIKVEDAVMHLKVCSVIVIAIEGTGWYIDPNESSICI